MKRNPRICNLIVLTLAVAVWLGGCGANEDPQAVSFKDIDTLGSWGFDDRVFGAWIEVSDPDVGSTPEVSGIVIRNSGEIQPLGFEANTGFLADQEERCPWRITRANGSRMVMEVDRWFIGEKVTSRYEYRYEVAGNQLRIADWGYDGSSTLHRSSIGSKVVNPPATQFEAELTREGMDVLTFSNAGVVSTSVSAQATKFIAFDGAEDALMIQAEGVDCAAVTVFVFGFVGPGTYPLTGKWDYVYYEPAGCWCGGGDVIEVWQSDPAKDTGVLTITTFDAVTGRCSGNVSVELHNFTGFNISMTGNFDVPIIESR